MAPTAHTINWIEVTIQWIFFFALLSIFLYPAFTFKNLAKLHNRKGWVYFIVGLAVGIVGFNLGHVVVFPLRYYVVPKEYVTYLSLVLFLSAYLFYRFSFKYLDQYFTKSKE